MRQPRVKVSNVSPKTTCIKQAAVRHVRFARYRFGRPIALCVCVCEQLGSFCDLHYCATRQSLGWPVPNQHTHANRLGHALISVSLTDVICI